MLIVFSYRFSRGLTAKIIQKVTLGMSKRDEKRVMTSGIEPIRVSMEPKIITFSYHRSSVGCRLKFKPSLPNRSR